VVQGNGGHGTRDRGHVFPTLPSRRAGSSIPGVSARPVCWGRTPLCPPSCQQLHCPTLKGHPELFPASTQFSAGSRRDVPLPPGAAPQGTFLSSIPGTAGTGDPAQGPAVSRAAVAPPFPPPRGVPSTAPHACACVWMQAPCSGLPGGLEFTVAKGTRGEAAPCRSSKKTLFPAKFLDTFPFTQLRLEKRRGPRDFPPSR